MNNNNNTYTHAENTQHINTGTEADCQADMDYHMNTADDNAMPECQSVVTATDCHTVVSMTNWQSNHGVTDWQSEKTLLESFKDSIRGASLPALAEKDLGTISVTFPEEVTPTEETKDSLTGGSPSPHSWRENNRKP